MDAWWKIICDVASECGIELTRVPPEVASDLWSEAVLRFGLDGGLSTEHIREPEVWRAKGSWESIADYPHHGPVIMFLNPRDSAIAFQIESLRDVGELLAEAPPFNFLVLDPKLTFLLAHDEYERLCGVGAAAEYVRMLREDAVRE